MVASPEDNLTQAQNELYQWIKNYLREFQHSPSIRQMMQAMDLKSPAPIQSRLKHLQEKGYLKWQEGKARTLQIVDEIVEGVPILGSVAAGGLIETYSDIQENLDLSDESFPHMSFKEATIGNIQCRIMRISFTGEQSYEINVQASYGKDLWEKCIEAGKEFNITPYGTETMHLLRAEKGFIIVGQDTDGTMTPIDLQMDWIVSKKKYDFIGKRSLYRSDTMKEDRKQLVGLLTEDPNVILEEGAQIVSELNQSPVEMLGHVTSSYFSPNLNKSIALAVVRGGKDMMGKQLFVPMENKNINVTVANPVFYDEKNERLNA